MSPITTHVLDIGSGKPAAGVRVVLERITEGGPALMAEGATDQDGRITSWLSGPVDSGHYRLRFATGDWYQKRKLDRFYPEVTIDFTVADTDSHYHVPLLLNQWGYSTYRGS